MGVEVPDKSVEVLRVLAENAYNWIEQSWNLDWVKYLAFW
jgi:hypothetical protein